MNSEQATDHLDPDALRRRLLAAITANREPGFHLPGYFLDIPWPRIGERSIEQTLSTGPYCTDAAGVAHPAVLGVLVDSALANAPRVVMETGGRLATVHLDVQYTGQPARGALHIEATVDGFFDSGAVRQAIPRAVLKSDGQAVCYATGAFVQMPPPPGRTLPVKYAPIPATSLALKALDEQERAVMRAAKAALAAADMEHAFIDRFWGIVPKKTATGATCRVKIGLQIGNRVGHVQGGILLGLAEATASAAVPGHPAISNISAWYLRPGQGKALNVKSRVLQQGRSFAVVHTEVRNADRGLVLEAVSNHAAVGS